MGRLTTHVLDTAAGIPAQGMRVELHRLDCRRSRACWHRSRPTPTDAVRRRCSKATRCAAGRYTLTFHVADYFRVRGTTLPDPAFPRRGRDPFRHRRSAAALPRTAAGIAVELFHLSRQLTRMRRRERCQLRPVDVGPRPQYPFRARWRGRRTCPTCRRPRPCSNICVSMSAAPAPRKVAPKAIAAPARSCSANATDDGRMRYRAINSCIRFLPTIDGKELVTVESLAGDGDDAASGAAGDGRPARLAMRLLHAGLRHVVVCAVPAQADAATRGRTRSAGRQSVPLHRLSADHRCRLQRCMRMRTPSRWSREQAQAPRMSQCCKVYNATQRLPCPASSRRAASTNLPLRSPLRRSRCCLPAAPMSACG